MELLGKYLRFFFLILSLISSLTITINFSHAFVFFFFFSEISEKARLDLFCILISSLTP